VRNRGCRRFKINAALAIEMFCYRGRKYIGAYMTVLGRTDPLAFGGGIGEHPVTVREQVCLGLELLGIIVDPERNRARTGARPASARSIHPISVYVVPLDEELDIARAAARLLSGQGEPNG
jgi:acetate kinase